MYKILRRQKFINQLGQKSAFGRFLSCVGINLKLYELYRTTVVSTYIFRILFKPWKRNLFRLCLAASTATIHSSTFHFLLWSPNSHNTAIKQYWGSYKFAISHLRSLHSLVLWTSKSKIDTPYKFHEFWEIFEEEINHFLTFPNLPTLESRINEQVVYWRMEKNPTYTHLFGTIRLLIFSKKSHLYVYSHLYFY